MESVESIIGYALGTAFENHTIYTEQVPQNLAKPCFFVLPLEVSHEQQLGNRYRREYPMVVHYFGDDIQAVADKLTVVLEVMEYNGDRICGYKMSYHVEDGVLMFDLTVRRILARPVEAASLMEKMEME